MNFKNLIIFLSLFLSISTYPVFSSNLECSQKLTKSHSTVTDPTDPIITYVRVFHDGIWWIQVYENDSFVYEYIDPEQ